MQKIYLVRHGETEWTASHQHTGLTDIPLTDIGKEQAKWLIPRLAGQSFAHIFVSPLQRAHHTFEIAKPEGPHEIDPDLLEWDYGDYEGLKTVDIRKTVPDWNVFTHGVPNGESIEDITARADRVLAKAKAVDGDVALFSSGHFSRCLAARWLGLPLDMGKNFRLSTASVSILSFERENPVIFLWNETPR